MYWKQGKNFVDKRPWHVLDSTFANDADDSFGLLQFLGPAGPFAFGMKNCAFIGSSPPGIAALAAGQHCGLLGGAGPCNVQYVLEDVDFSRMQAPQPRLAFGANTAASQAAVLPVFLTKDASLGGFRSIISAHLDGFRALGCQPLSAKWAKPGALGCNGMIRRLNVWGGGARLQIEGPGYESTPDWTFPTEGRSLDAALKHVVVRTQYWQGFVQCHPNPLLQSRQDCTVKKRGYVTDVCVFADLQLQTAASLRTVGIERVCFSSAAQALNLRVPEAVAKSKRASRSWRMDSRT